MPLKDRLNLAADPIFLMDGSAFIYRGFFANQNLRRSDGFPTGALVLLTRLLLRILCKEKPRHLLFIRDGKGKNFRHEIYPLYKANREAMPEDLVMQLDPIERMVRALGLNLEISQGCEADDCIASLAARFSAEHPVIIVGGDKDLKQCLSRRVFLWDPEGKDENLITETDFRDENGVNPAQWPDVQALLGDTSDNIPGVPGIGPKAAKQIFEICSSLEEIRAGFSRLPPKFQSKLCGHLDKAFIWRRLTTLSLNVCADMTLEGMLVRPINASECRSLTDEFELVALRREMENLLRLQQSAASPETPALPPPNREESATKNTTKRPAPHARKEKQTNLLDMADLTPTLPATEASALADLPYCVDRTVVLLWSGVTGEPLRIAVGDAWRDAQHAPATAPLQEFAWEADPTTLAPWLSGAGRLVCTDFKILLRNGICRAYPSCASPPCFDLGLAAWLLNPEDNDYSWPRLKARFGAGLQRDTVGPAGLALAVAQTLHTRLVQNNLDGLYAEMELTLTPVLAAMEERGVAIDATAFRTFLVDVRTEINNLTAKIYSTAGTSFNLRSARQLGETLFNVLHLPAPRKTRGGQASTSQETLEKLAGRHTVVDLVLQFRKLEKIRSTYLEPLPRLVDQAGRLHTTFNQKGTATGRLSSSNPNLQNIPVRGTLGKRMRASFIAAPAHTLVCADYSQIELRVLAHMSQDATLLDAFHNNEDIHARTAALIYDLPQNKVSRDERRNAKTINFGLIYGMGAQKLARELKIAAAEAKDFIARYFAHLTGLKAFYDNVERLAKQQGFVSTLGGRRRFLPSIHSANGQAFALARRQAINTMIQGSAADIIKLAMLAVDNDTELASMHARLLLQVHDELLLEVPEEKAQAAGARTAALMAAVAPAGAELSVPLAVDWGVGRNWAEAH